MSSRGKREDNKIALHSSYIHDKAGITIVSMGLPIGLTFTQVGGLRLRCEVASVSGSLSRQHKQYLETSKEDPH